MSVGKPDPRSVVCPYCRAGVSVPCENMAGRAWQKDIANHRERAAAARRARTSASGTKEARDE